jgi:choline kinase
MSAYIILAAGPSRNMHTKGPVGLLKHEDVQVIDHQIKTILKADKDADICFVLGFKGDKIVSHLMSKQYNLRVVINHSYSVTSQVDSLRLGMNALRATDCFIIHGDMVFNEAAIKKTTKSNIVISKTDKADKVGVSRKRNSVLNLEYGLTPTWGQIVYLTKDDFIYAKQLINSFKRNKLTYEFINMLSNRVEFITNDSADIRTVEIIKTHENIAD